MFKKIISWFDNQAVPVDSSALPTKPDWKDIDWLRVIPFLLLHVACFAVIWVGFSWFALGFALMLYFPPCIPHFAPVPVHPCHLRRYRGTTRAAMVGITSPSSSHLLG
jgi:hypothetical protein